MRCWRGDDSSSAASATGAQGWLDVSRVADAKAPAAVLVCGFPLAPLVLDLSLVLEPLGVLGAALMMGGMLTSVLE